jgi:hypothetical protein
MNNAAIERALIRGEQKAFKTLMRGHMQAMQPVIDAMKDADSPEQGVKAIDLYVNSTFNSALYKMLRDGDVLGIRVGIFAVADAMKRAQRGVGFTDDLTRLKSDISPILLDTGDDFVSQLYRDYFERYSYASRFDAVTGTRQSLLTEVRNGVREDVQKGWNDILRSAQKQGMGWLEIRRMVAASNYLNEYFEKDATYRIKRIAITETQAAAKRMQHEVVKKTMTGEIGIVDYLGDTYNLEIPPDKQMNKRWNSFIDARTRFSHMQMDAQTKKIDEGFEMVLSRGGTMEIQYPQDVNLPVEERVFCRCYVTYAFEFDEAQTAPVSQPKPKPRAVQQVVQQAVAQAATGNTNLPYWQNEAIDFLRDNPIGSTKDWSIQSEQMVAIFRSRGIDVNDTKFVDDVLRKEPYEMNVRMQKLSEVLDDGWDFEKPWIDRVLQSNRSIRLMMESDADSYGYCWNTAIRGSDGKLRLGGELNLGHETDSVKSGVAWIRSDAGTCTYINPNKSRWNVEFTAAATTVHEMAHFLTSTSRMMNSPVAIEFWEELRKIKFRYKKEYKKLNAERYAIEMEHRQLRYRSMVDESVDDDDLLEIAARHEKVARKLEEIELGDYAMHTYKKPYTRHDEFWAESFKTYYLSDNPSPYAVEAVKLARKYFSK